MTEINTTAIATISVEMPPQLKSFLGKFLNFVREQLEIKGQFVICEENNIITVFAHGGTLQEYLKMPIRTIYSNLADLLEIGVLQDGGHGLPQGSSGRGRSVNCYKFPLDVLSRFPLEESKNVLEPKPTIVTAQKKYSRTDIANALSKIDNEINELNVKREKIKNLLEMFDILDSFLS